MPDNHFKYAAKVAGVNVSDDAPSATARSHLHNPSHLTDGAGLVGRRLVVLRLLLVGHLPSSAPVDGVGDRQGSLFLCFLSEIIA